MLVSRGTACRRSRMGFAEPCPNAMLAPLCQIYCFAFSSPTQILSLSFAPVKRPVPPPPTPTPRFLTSRQRITLLHGQTHSHSSPSAVSAKRLDRRASKRSRLLQGLRSLEERHAN